MYALLLEVEVTAEGDAAFVHATRLYRRSTRAEVGNLRLEFLRRQEQPSAFYVYELYRDRAAYELHMRAEHTQRWFEACAGLTCEMKTTMLLPEGVDARPPPLSQAARPALESSAWWPSGSDEANARRSAQVRRSGGVGDGGVDRVRERERVRGAEREVGEQRLPRVKVVLESLEFAAAHAGFLQSTPDACFLVGMYAWCGRGLEPAARAVYRRALRESRPCKLGPRELLFDVPLILYGLPLRVGVLMLALEENGGRDVATVYREMADPQAFRLWAKSEGVPNPLVLADWFSPERMNPEAVEVLQNHVPMSEVLETDTWVGAASAQFAFAEIGDTRVARLHVISDDDRNDWLAQISAQLYH
ncbi:MAG: putative quinol monooxygenase [Myxococcota bacterium]